MEASSEVPQLPRSGGPFSELDDLLLVALSVYLDDPSLTSVLRTCRLWRDAERRKRRPLWRSRVFSRYGPLRLPSGAAAAAAATTTTTTTTDLGDAWRDLAVRLRSGKMDYAGAAIDYFTSGFEPYPMRLYMHRVHPIAKENWIRWPTLGNAVTKLGAVRLRRGSRTDLFEEIQFSEVLLIEGNDIAIPNHYAGHVCGPAIVGVYPGGAFYLMMEEATARTGSSDATETMSDGDQSLDGFAPYAKDFDSVRRRLVLRQDLTFLGLVVMELTPFSFETDRQPAPYSAVIELRVGSQLSMHRVAEAINDLGGSQLEIDGAAPGFCGHLRLRVKHDRVDYVYAVLIARASNSNQRSRNYEVVIFVTSPPMPLAPGLDVKEVQEALEDPPKKQLEISSPSAAHFMAKARMYAWVNGDCLIGILKNAESQQGSFALQLHHGNLLSDLGIRRAVAARSNLVSME